jgi:PPOX class probable F420-dependent enzyme
LSAVNKLGGLAVAPDPAEAPVAQDGVAGRVRDGDVQPEPVVPVHRPLRAEPGEHQVRVGEEGRVGRFERRPAGKIRPMPRTIATTTTVDRDGLLDFARPRHRAVLITRRADGAPQTSPVTAGVDDAGRIVISTYPERAKTANARRDPRVSVLVLSDDFGGPWVQLDGDAEVLDLPDALEPLVEYYRCISGEHPDWDEYRSAMTTQGKSLIRVTPTRWGPIATGGFPPRLADAL